MDSLSFENVEARLLPEVTVGQWEAHQRSTVVSLEQDLAHRLSLGFEAAGRHRALLSVRAATQAMETLWLMGEHGEVAYVEAATAKRGLFDVNTLREICVMYGPDMLNVWLTSWSAGLSRMAAGRPCRAGCEACASEIG